MQNLKRYLSREFQGAPITDWLDLYAGSLYLGFFGLFIMSLIFFVWLSPEALLVSLITAFSCFCLGGWCSYLSDWIKDEPDREYLRTGVTIVSFIFAMVCVFIYVPESWTSFNLPTRDIFMWCLTAVGYVIASWPSSVEKES